MRRAALHWLGKLHFWPKLHCQPSDRRMEVRRDMRRRVHRDGAGAGPQLARRERQRVRLHRRRVAARLARLPSGELLGLSGGPLDAVDPDDPAQGLCVLGYFGDVWHVPFVPSSSPGELGSWGEQAELLTPHGAPFTRDANFHGQGSLCIGALTQPGRHDLWVGDVGSNVGWCCRLGTDGEGLPIFDTPRKVKQYNPMVNGGFFSVPTAGDLSGTGLPDLVVGGIEGYLLHYRCVSAERCGSRPPCG